MHPSPANRPALVARQVLPANPAAQHIHNAFNCGAVRQLHPPVFGPTPLWRQEEHIDLPQRIIDLALMLLLAPI